MSRNRDYSRWLVEEREALEDMATRMRFNEIVERMTELAQVNGWPMRTPKAIAERLCHSGMAVGHGNAITAKTPPTKWSDDEVAFLESMIDDVPFPVMMQRMLKRAVQQGWPLRSEDSIATRLKRMGYRCGSRYGEWLTIGSSAMILGCPPSRVAAWTRRPEIRQHLKPWRVNRYWYIKRASWRRLAREMPRVLGGFSADTLFLLLEDRDLAESIANQYPREMGDFRIRCIETGKIWPSCSEASRMLHCDESTISLAIRKGRPVYSLGMTFERVLP